MATFDLDPETLPPLTKAIREAWTRPGGPSNQPNAPYPNAKAFNAILDAIHNLETRLGALE